MNIPPRAPTREEFVDQLFAWLEEHGNSHFDESVTQFEHALQTARRSG